MAKNKNKKGTSKSQCMKIHFEKRCLERVGRILNEKALVRAIQGFNLKFICKLSNRISVYEFMDGDRPFKILYDKNRHRCITILDEEMKLKTIDLTSDKITREGKLLLIMQQYGFNWEEAHDFLESL